MGNFQHATVTVGTSATLIVSSPTNESDGMLVRNNGAAPVYLGGSGVTADVASTGGLLVSAGESVQLSTTGAVSGDLYGVTAAGTAYVTVIYV